VAAAIFARLSLSLPAAELKRWEQAPLLPEYQRLRGADGFAWLDMGDEDLLGWEMTVEGATTLDEALAIAQGFIEKRQVARWEHFVNEKGADAVRVQQDGPLSRQATCADLLALLARMARDGVLFTETEAQRDAGKIEVRGVVDYDGYRTHRLPWLYALSCAVRAGGQGSLTFLGEDEGEFVTTFADAPGDSVAIREVDPQNLTEDDWEARIGGIATLEEAHAAWRTRTKKKPRRRNAR
jgi:hypothetical protein